ncbi:DUF1453 domain-containing protein [Jatrophihabitans sp. YIM 134969]
MDIVTVLLIVVGVAYVLVRRVVGDIVQVKSLLVLPVVLTAVGGSQVGDLGPLDLASVVFLVAGGALSVVIGAVRGTTVHLGERRGELWMRYCASTVALWVVNIVAKIALVPVEVAVTHGSVASATHTMLLSVGLGILVESAVVLLRAMHRDGTVVWSKGDEGRAHTPSPAFDAARERVRAAGGRGLRAVVPTGERDW